MKKKPLQTEIKVLILYKIISRCVMMYYLISFKVKIELFINIKKTTKNYYKKKLPKIVKKKILTNNYKIIKKKK